MSLFWLGLSFLWHYFRGCESEKCIVLDCCDGHSVAYACPSFIRHIFQEAFKEKDIVEVIMYIINWISEIQGALIVAIISGPPFEVVLYPKVENPTFGFISISQLEGNKGDYESPLIPSNSLPPIPLD
jgi:hypothetical protein